MAADENPNGGKVPLPRLTVDCKKVTSPGHGPGPGRCSGLCQGLLSALADSPG